jgi:membrane dipeptidase
MKLVDFHCDTLLRIQEEESKSLKSLLKKNPWHVDLEKLKKADSLIQVFAIFLPPAHELTQNGMVKSHDVIEQYRFFKSQYQLFLKELNLNKRSLGHLLQFKDIEKNKRKGKISALLSIEEGNVIDNRLHRLDEFHAMGFRLITLLWNHENCLGYPHSPVSSLMKKGLKPFGKEVVQHMEDLGIIVDVSHLSDGGFADVAALTRKPFVASHSNSRAVTNSTRNLTDAQIRLLADRGGIMGINFFPEFLTDSANPVSRISHMVEHINHIKDVGGLDVIALGTDFDGISGNLEITNIGQISLLEQALDRAGYSTGEIEKIWSSNALRVLEELLL